jgi:hypothetical protein
MLMPFSRTSCKRVGVHQLTMHTRSARLSSEAKREYKHRFLGFRPPRLNYFQRRIARIECRYPRTQQMKKKKCTPTPHRSYPTQPSHPSHCLSCCRLRWGWCRFSLSILFFLSLCICGVFRTISALVGFLCIRRQEK